MDSRPYDNSPASRFARVVTAVAVGKVVIATVSVALALATGAAGSHAARSGLLLVHALAFGVAGLLLRIGGRADPRAGDLGAVFLLIASAFADHLVAPLWPRPTPVVTLARAGLALQVDAFTPYFMWRFARAFPRAPVAPVSDRRFAHAISACLALGAVLLAANLLAAAATLAPRLVSTAVELDSLSRHAPFGAYWFLQFALSAGALVALGRRARLSPPDERQRVALLVAGLLVGTLPIVIRALLSAVPALRAALPLRVAGWVIYPTLLSTPFATAYAVLVHRALDVRLVVRRALRYALARHTLLAAAAIPLALLAGFVYRNRDLRIAELVLSPEGATLGTLALLALAAGRWRDRLLARLDARFFREQRRAEVVLGALVSDCSRTRDRSELTTVLRAALDRALHPEAVHVLFRDDRQRAFADTTAEVPLVGTDGTLSAWLAGHHGPAIVNRTKPSAARRTLRAADRQWLASAARRTLRAADRQWLADAAARLLVPVRDARGRLVAFFTLGAKKSELPYTAEDRALLRAVAGAVALALASYQAPAAGRAADDRYAAECPRCGLVYAWDVPACGECRIGTRAAMLPQTVGGKFATHRRIGAGAMGVVYRGLDLTLGRTVAIKTLPFVSREDTERMRREARAMATVTHENLALIYTAEVWHDRPMLVVEYLGGGILADRLADGPLPFREWRTLGVALATALAALHREGVVHGDVKPSNIGFTTGGTPKLLDFGLAHVVPTGGPQLASAAGSNGPPRAGGAWPGRLIEAGADASASRSIAFGTPRYMAPEACLRVRPSEVDDLWSVCVVLYEAVVGGHPFAHTEQGGPDIRPFASASTGELAALFREGLAEDPSQRPATAEQLRARLLRLRGS